MTAENRHFARHYLEMLVSMVVGMIVLGGALGLVVHVHRTGPLLAEMAVTMTLPMVLWMRYRGHGWQPCLEMAASMVIPALGALALLGFGTLTSRGPLMMIEHGVMLPSMLAVMLLRREEYSGAHGKHRAAVSREVAA
jgi:hypothetical protein